MRVDKAALTQWLQWPQAPRPEDVRKLREEAGLTQAHAARCVHVLTRTWQKWESGKNEMHPAMWELFVRKLLDREETQRVAASSINAETQPVETRPGSLN